MVDGERSGSRFLRWAFGGSPRVWLGVVWVALGVARFVFAAFEPSLTRVLIGTGWVIIGVAQIVLAVRRRQGQRALSHGRTESAE